VGKTLKSQAHPARFAELWQGGGLTVAPALHRGENHPRYE